MKNKKIILKVISGTLVMSSVSFGGVVFADDTTNNQPITTEAQMQIEQQNKDLKKPIIENIRNVSIPKNNKQQIKLKVKKASPDQKVTTKIYLEDEKDKELITYDLENRIEQQGELLINVEPKEEMTGSTKMYVDLEDENGEKSTYGFTLNVNEDMKAMVYSDKYEVLAGEVFDAYISLDGMNNIYAEDLKLKYDTRLFTFKEVKVARAYTKIFHQTVDESGNMRYIMGHMGERAALNGSEQKVLKLTFEAKDLGGKGLIEVKSGQVANGVGQEFSLFGATQEFIVRKYDRLDVTQNGIVSLGDLAVASKMYRTASDNWGEFKPDVDENGFVDEIDLSEIAKELSKY